MITGVNWFRLDERNGIWHAEDTGRPLKKTGKKRSDNRRKEEEVAFEEELLLAA